MIDDFRFHGSVELVYEFETACPLDLDGSGAVGLSDLLIVLANWGPCPGCPADIDGDGDVSFIELLSILSAWGPC